MGGELVAISPQQEKYSKQVVKKHDLTFPVLFDTDNKVADQFGLKFNLPDKLKELYSGFGIDLVRFNGNEKWQLPMSGQFIISSDGIIQDVNVNPDYTKRPEPEDTLGTLKCLLVS